ncbi:fructosamine kinase family protein [Dactylosporangium sp. CS-047395]|uniref:fructosamine kinase family protein n=1 Tax=Dactylosporangium sp. CS-047395 TaxID=3239936 RepID=UPI003D902376
MRAVIGRVDGFFSLDDLASHPAGIYRAGSARVFAKLGDRTHFEAEIKGLELVGRHVATPKPIAIVEHQDQAVLLLEAIDEVPAAQRTDEQWRGVGRALATLHGTKSTKWGLDAFDGFFGPLPQDNRPVASNKWRDFYRERRIRPRLEQVSLPKELTQAIEQAVERAEMPDAVPSLLHGDPQQNNLLTSADKAWFIDVAPYYGHPEADLALVDYFAPVPAALFDGYREVRPIEEGFAERKELWRLHGYLAVIAVEGERGTFLPRIEEAVARVRCRHVGSAG